MKKIQSFSYSQKIIWLLFVFFAFIFSFTSCQKEEVEWLGGILERYYHTDSPRKYEYSDFLDKEKVIIANNTTNNTPIRFIIFSIDRDGSSSVNDKDYFFYKESDDENFVNNKVDVGSNFWDCGESVIFEKLAPIHCAENEYFKAEFNEDFSQLTYTIKPKINELISDSYTHLILRYFGDNSQYNAVLENKTVEDLSYCTSGIITLYPSKDFIINFK
ncbi:MAG: hypothetical protein R3Y50_00595 [Rikenellaceae bacterium]